MAKNLSSAMKIKVVVEPAIGKWDIKNMAWQENAPKDPPNQRPLTWYRVSAKGYTNKAKRRSATAMFTRRRLVGLFIPGLRRTTKMTKTFPTKAARNSIT